MDIESTFAEVLGRAPTEAERLFLQRLSGSWDVRGNEALLALLFVLQFGTGWQHYPARCAESVRRAVRAALQRNLATPVPSRGLPRPLARGLALAAAAFVAVLGIAIASLFVGVSYATQPSRSLGGSHDASTPILDVSPPVAISASALPAAWMLLKLRLRRLKDSVQQLRRPDKTRPLHPTIKPPESRSP